jgi:hypothetical protein
MSTESSEDENDNSSKKVDDDESDDDVANASNAAPVHSSQGYHNLETFQRKKLKQKVSDLYSMGL